MTKEQKAKEIIAKIRKGSYEDWVQWIGEGLEEYAAIKAQPLVDLLKVLRLGVPEGHDAEKAIEAALASYAGSGEPVPQWYTEKEMYDYLRHKQYSHEIAGELSKDYAINLQRAFEKGHQKSFETAGSAEGEKDVELPERIKELFAEAEKTIADIKEAMPGAKKELRRLNEQQARVVEGVKENNPVSLLKELREKSVQRAIECFKTYKNVPITYWTTALAGEIGELCNMVKKMERVNNGGIDAGSSYTAASITPEMLKEEVGGIAIYLDLLASLLDIDLASAIVDTFNEKSVKYAFPYLLQEPPAATNQEGGKDGQ